MLDKLYDIERLLEDADDWTINRVYLFTVELVRKRRKMAKRLEKKKNNQYNKKKAERQEGDWL